MRQLSGLAASLLFLVACQAPASPPPAPGSPNPRASASVQPRAHASATPRPTPSPLPTPVAQPSVHASPKPGLVLPLKISSPDCGRRPSETEIRADGLVIRRSLPAASDLFKGAWIERRVRLSASQLESLQTAVKSLAPPSPQPTANCEQGRDLSQWELARSDGSHASWTSRAWDPASGLIDESGAGEILTLIERLTHDAAPDMTPQRYAAPFWSVIGGECSGPPRLHYSLDATGKLQAESNVDKAGTVFPLRARQLSDDEARVLLATLEKADPVRAYNQVVRPLGPLSDTADCRSIETLVVTANGELRAIPWTNSRIYAEQPQTLSFYDSLAILKQQMEGLLDKSRADAK